MNLSWCLRHLWLKHCEIWGKVAACFEHHELVFSSNVCSSAGNVGIYIWTMRITPVMHAFFLVEYPRDKDSLLLTLLSVHIPVLGIKRWFLGDVMGPLLQKTCKLLYSELLDDIAFYHLIHVRISNLKYMYCSCWYDDVSLVKRPAIVFGALCKTMPCFLYSSLHGTCRAVVCDGFYTLSCLQVIAVTMLNMKLTWKISLECHFYDILTL